jgi:spermidine/putrescine transport system permease protein
MESWRRNPLIFWLTAVPPTVWLVLFFAIPLGGVWILSFGEKDGLVDIDITWTLANYLRALDPLYLEIFTKSFWISGATTAICLAIGFPVAMGIVFAPARWKPVLLLLVILPFWTNLLIRTYALIAVLRTRGHVNFTLEWMADLVGLPFEPLELLYNNTAVVIGLVYVHLPFMVLPLYAALERLDRSFIEAALDLGASQARAFRTVVVPLALPGILSGCLLVFIPSLGSYLTPALLGGTDSQMIANVIERQFKSANDWPFGAALSFLLMYVTFGALALRAFLSRGRAGGDEAL